jgi:hypothetical protein
LENEECLESKAIKETIKILNTVSVVGIVNVSNLFVTYNTLNNILQQVCKKEQEEGKKNGNE